MVGLRTPNRIDRPGTPELAWDSWPGLRHLSAVDPRAWPGVVVVASVKSTNVVIELPPPAETQPRKT